MEGLYPVCPICESDNYDIIDIDNDIDVVVERCVCCDCKIEFQMYFKKDLYKIKIID